MTPLEIDGTNLESLELFRGVDGNDEVSAYDTEADLFVVEEDGSERLIWISKPKAIEDLVLTVSGTTATLSWTNVSLVGTEIRIERRLDDSGAWTILTDTLATTESSYSDSGGGNDTYRYRITVLRTVEGHALRESDPVVSGTVRGVDTSEVLRVSAGDVETRAVQGVDVSEVLRVSAGDVETRSVQRVDVSEVLRIRAGDVETRSVQRVDVSEVLRISAGDVETRAVQGVDVSEVLRISAGDVGVLTKPSCAITQQAASADGCTDSATISYTVSASGGGGGPYTGIGAFTREVTRAEPSVVVTHTVMVVNGLASVCMATLSATFASRPSPSCTITQQAASVDGCTDSATISYTVSASGGCGPYTGIGAFSTTVTRDSPSRIVVHGIVDDAGSTASCSRLVSATFASRPSPSCAITQQAASVDGCTDSATISYTVSASGGCGPYTGTGAFSTTVTRDSPSRIVVHGIVDDAGSTASCSRLVSATFASRPSPSCAITQQAASAGGCTDSATISYTVSASGGCGPYTGIGAFSTTVTRDSPSRIVVHGIVDDAGSTASCSRLVSATFASRPSPSCAITQQAASAGGCTDSATISYTVSASGGCGPYTGTGAFSTTVTRDSPSRIVVHGIVDDAGTSASCLLLVSATFASRPDAVSCSLSGNTISGTAGDTLTPSAEVTTTGGCPPIDGGTGTVEADSVQSDTARITFVALSHTVTDSLGQTSTCTATSTLIWL